MIIDVKVVLESVVFWQKHQNLSLRVDKPTAIGADEVIFVVTPRKSVVHNGAHHLEIYSQKDDVLRWHFSLMASDRYYAILYDIIDKPSSVNLMTDLQVIIDRKSRPLPNPDNPTEYISFEYIDVYLQSRIREFGKRNYTLLYYILERDAISGAFSTKGYFFCDFKLKILPRMKDL